jgi:hypothetical protein
MAEILPPPAPDSQLAPMPGPEAMDGNPAAEVQEPFQLPQRVRYEADDTGQVQEAVEYSADGDVMDWNKSVWMTQDDREILINTRGKDSDEQGGRLYVEGQTVYNLSWLDLNEDERQTTPAMWTLKQGEELPVMTVGNNAKVGDYETNPIGKVEVKTFSVPSDSAAPESVQQRGENPFQTAKQQAQAILEANPTPSEITSQPEVETREEVKTVYPADQNGNVYTGTRMAMPDTTMAWRDRKETRRLNRRVLVTTNEGHQYYVHGDRVIQVNPDRTQKPEVFDELPEEGQLSDVTIGEGWTLPDGSVSQPVEKIEIFEAKYNADDLPDIENAGYEPAAGNNPFAELDAWIKPYQAGGYAGNEGPISSFKENLKKLHSHRKNLGKTAVADTVNTSFANDMNRKFNPPAGRSYPEQYAEMWQQHLKSLRAAGHIPAERPAAKETDIEDDDWSRGIDGLRAAGIILDKEVEAEYINS